MKRALSIAALALAATAPALGDGPGSWVVESSLNVARQEVGAARIGDTVYVTGGLLSSGGFPLVATSSVEAYDLQTAQWSFVTSMPVALDHMATVAYDGKLYVAGGKDSTTSLAS